MDASFNLTGYQEKLLDRCDDLINHGFGKIYLTVSSQSDGSVKIFIEAGESYIFILKKEIPLDKLNIM